MQNDTVKAEKLITESKLGPDILEGGILMGCGGQGSFMAQVTFRLSLAKAAVPNGE